MARAASAFLLLALAGCMNEYHPEYHPETVYAYVQTVRVESPPPPPPATVVIVMSPPPPESVAPPARGTRARLEKVSVAPPAPAPAAFQAAPVFAADDRGR